MISTLARLTAVSLLIVASQSAKAEEFLSPKPLVPQAKPAPAQKPPPKPAARTNAPAQEAANAPKFDISEEIGDWKLQCLATPAKNCQMSQRRVNPSNNQLLIWMEVTRSTAPKETNQISVMVPLGLRATTPLVLTVDDQSFASVQLLTCIQTGCVYGGELSQTELQTLLKGNLVKTEVQDLRGQRFALTISMRGFGNAFLKTAVYLQKS
jgi:invasion protein IalB